MHLKTTELYAYNPVIGTRKGNIYEWTTYKELGEMVRNARKFLSKLGVGPTKRVAIISNNRLEWAVLMHATMSLGSQMIPMYENQLEQDWQYIINDCDATVLVAATDKVYNLVKDYPGKVGKIEHVLSLDINVDDAHSYHK
jgi:long-chain acyl-CoA synthetase